MPNIRIKDIPSTASATSSTDFIGIDGSANGTRKLNAYSPTFGGNLTVSGTGTSSFAGPVTAFDNTNGGAFYVLRDAGNNRGSFYFGRNNSGTIQITGSVNGSSDTTSVNNGILTINALS